MPRYKSTLTAEIDAKRFEHAADIPVPPTGLGKRLDAMHDWCAMHCEKDDWAGHGFRTACRADYVRFYFTYPNIADAFAIAFDGTRQDKSSGIWPKL
ncbi:MAG: hypothetical protein ABJG15_09870 [Hyphomonadaceae bacterium]